MTTWKDIDPETRDLSTPELWDAWREEVRGLQFSGAWAHDAETASTASIGEVSDRFVQVFYYNVNGKCVENCHVTRPDSPTLESRLTDALARIEKLEAFLRRCPTCYQEPDSTCSRADGEVIELGCYECNTRWPVL